MRKVDDGKKKKKEKKKENNDENSGPLTSLPVVRLNGDRLQRRPLVPKEQAGAELGQGQLKLKLGFISIKI